MFVVQLMFFILFFQLTSSDGWPSLTQQFGGAQDTCMATDNPTLLRDRQAERETERQTDGRPVDQEKLTGCSKQANGNLDNFNVHYQEGGAEATFSLLLMDNKPVVNWEADSFRSYMIISATICLVIAVLLLGLLCFKLPRRERSEGVSTGSTESIQKMLIFNEGTDQKNENTDL